MSEAQTAEQIEDEARAAQQAARAASLGGRNKGGRPKKVVATQNEPLPPEEAPEKSHLQKQALNNAAADARRIERLKAARVAVPESDDPEVPTRVTKKGDGKLSTGEHIAGLGDLTYEHKEIVAMPLSRAKFYENLGYVEIQDDEG